MAARKLFQEMHKAVAHRPKVQLNYTDEEFMEHFELKAWKGRELAPPEEANREVVFRV
jgi:hypothetical protein